MAAAAAMSRSSRCMQQQHVCSSRHHQNHSRTAWPAQCSALRRDSLAAAAAAAGDSTPISRRSQHDASRRLRALSNGAGPGSLASSREDEGDDTAGCGQQQQQRPGASTPPTAAASSAAEGDYGYLQEYAALKAQLLGDTRKAGGAVGAYILFTVDGNAALLAMLGAGASYAYLAWLCRDVDAVAPTDEVPLWEANKIDNLTLRRGAKLAAAYRKALSPRLLVPASLGLLLGVYQRVTGEPLPLLYAGCLLLGFLSYKGALVAKLVADLAPKSAVGKPERPMVEKIEDELDQWGRPKKRGANPIDVMPEDMQAKAYEQLDEQLAKEERRMQQD